MNTTNHALTDPRSHHDEEGAWTRDDWPKGGEVLWLMRELAIPAAKSRDLGELPCVDQSATKL